VTRLPASWSTDARSAGARSRRLVARTVPAASLAAEVRDAMFALFAASYAGADRVRFERDLAEKQLVILLSARAGGALRGFSTVHVRELGDADAPNGGGTLVYSGDTVIDRAYWGQKRLQLAFAALLVRLKLRRPGRPLYWFLISKGYRTYLLLANAFPRAVPRHDRPDDPALREIVDACAAARFGADYDAAAGVVRYAEAHERVRPGLAPLDTSLLANPHVRFFAERNPGHADGDELACLAEVRLRDLARILPRNALRGALGGVRGGAAAAHERAGRAA